MMSKTSCNCLQLRLRKSGDLLQKDVNGDALYDDIGDVVHNVTKVADYRDPLVVLAAMQIPYLPFTCSAA